MVVKGKEYKYRIGSNDFHCPVDVTMSYIGGKWKTVVLYYLIEGPLRFGELNERIPQITEKMLSIQLKALESDKLLIREVIPDRPPKVVYSLSPEGESLKNLLLEMEKWGAAMANKHGQLIEID